MSFQPPFAVITAVALLAAPMVHAQAATPEDHPGAQLAEAIAAQGCVLHQDDVNPLLEAAGLLPPQFPEMALPLLQDGILAPTGNGTLTLVNWGVCTGDAGTETEAETEADAETDAEATTDPESTGAVTE